MSRQAVATRPTFGRWLNHHVRRPANWLQLLRFGVVGASGYAVNLVAFGIAHGAGLGYQAAAIVAFCFAVTNNFWWNRHWTFAASRTGHAGHQAWRFLAVSLLGLVVNLVLLSVLVVATSLEEVAAQAVAVAAATPISFLGNRLWTFRRVR